MTLSGNQLKDFLDVKADQYNRPSFIERDPISIPHRFSQKQDIELMGFWAAVLAWGQRPVILKKADQLITLLDNSPYDFILNHQESDLKRFLAFKHRTFNATDALYFCQHFYKNTCTVRTGYTVGQQTTSTGWEMHKNGGCTSLGEDIVNTACQGGACKIWNTSATYGGLKNLICDCP